MTLTEALRADIEQRVDEGVWFLDHVMPDWADHVDLSKLDIGKFWFEDGCGCVVMQVTGQDFEAGTRKLGLGKFDTTDALGFDGLSWSLVNAERHGIDGWYYAHELWQEAVLDRRPNKLIGGERNLVAS